MKNVKIYETLNSVLEMQIKESEDNLLHLEGVFGVCGVVNNNNRIYTKENYQTMIEELQDKINKHALLGEMEHSLSMNVNLQNVSHRIDSVSIDEDGVVRGSLTILKTPNGQIAEAIIRSGSPLYVSSKAVGTIDENHVVTLTKLFGWDLVGSPGFSEAEVNLKENECFESISDNMVIISEKEQEVKQVEEPVQTQEHLITKEEVEQYMEEQQEEAKEEVKDEKKEDICTPYLDSLIEEIKNL